MIATNYDLNIQQHADFSTTFTFFDNDGVAIDLSTSTFNSQIKSKYSDTVPIISFTIVVAASVAKNDVTLSLTKVQTGAFTFQRALWDLLWTDGSAVTRRPISGNVFVSPEVTIV